MRSAAVFLLVVLAARLSWAGDDQVCQHLSEESVRCSVFRLDQVAFAVSRADGIRELSVLCVERSENQGELNLSPLLQFSSVTSLSVDRCKFDVIRRGTLRHFSSMKKLRVKTHNSEWSSAPLSLDAGCLEGLIELEDLDLSGNGLISLADAVFSDTVSLKVLNLTNNRLRDFSRLALVTSGLSLEVIDVSDNDYVNIPSAALGDHSSLRKLMMRRNHLLEIEELGLRGLSTLEVVDLAENRLNTLPAMMLSESVNLRELHLESNNISLLPPGVLNELTNLVTLNMSNNQLTSQWVKRDTFVGLSQLVVLDLSFNRLETLSDSMFEDLVSLQVLQLSHNQLQTLPADLFLRLRNVHTLSLSGNRLSRVDQTAFRGLSVLNRLLLSENLLEEIHPQAFSNMSQLEELRLEVNNLLHFPAAISSVAQLRHLDLADNQLSSIPGVHLASMKHLSLLRAAGNQITEIGTDLASTLETLTMLDLSRNQIEKVQAGAFGSASSLRAVRLDSNRLTSINGIFGNMSSLLWLNASDNAIEFFDYALFPGQLLWLDLHKNNIKVVGNFYSIHDKIQLETLDLSFNDIEHIDSTSVPDSIKYFIMSSNRLNTVQPGTLDKKTQLVRVDLSTNDLSELSIQAITLNASGDLTHLERVHLLIAGNPFFCDCTMDWLINIDSMTPARKYPKLLDASQVMCRFRAAPHQPVHLQRAAPSSFLCGYERHCFALCHCCNYVACDCEMRCPDGCSCYHDHAWSTNIVDCRRRDLQAIARTMPMDVSQLLVDGNSIHSLESHTFIGRQRLQLLQANSSAVQEIQNRSLNGLTALRVLRLEDNVIQKLRGDEFNSLRALEELYLHNNELSYIHPETFARLKSLTVLTLRGNQLVSFAVWQLTTNSYLVDLSISDNPWSCDCQFLAKMTQYVRENHAKIDDDRGLQCAYETEPPNCSGRDEKPNETLPHHRVSRNHLPVILIAAAVVLLMALVTACVVYRCRARVCQTKSLLHPAEVSTSSLDDKKPSNLDPVALPPSVEKMYDVFVTYSAQDTHFVNDMLTPMLETTDPTLRLCLLRRDAPSVNYLGDAVRHCVDTSMKTVLVLSRNFLDSEWCRFDFKASHLDALRSTRNIVAILYGVDRSAIEDELKLLLKGAAFITFGERDFWRKLRSVLPPGCQHKSLPRSISGHSYASRILYPSAPPSAASFADDSPSPTCSTVVSEDRSLGLNHFRSLSHPQQLRPRQCSGGGVALYGRGGAIPTVSASLSEPSEHVYMTIESCRTPPHEPRVYSTLEPEMRPYLLQRGERTHLRHNRTSLSSRASAEHRRSPSQSLWV